MSVNIQDRTERAGASEAVNWKVLFSRQTHSMKRTALRELLRLTARPDMISFGGGLPAAELFPLESVKSAARNVLERVGGQSLQYGETEGISGLRDWLAQKFSIRGLTVRRENVLITSGAQQALDLIGRVLLDAGDQVVVENPTYLALLSAWRPMGAEFVAVPSDNEGLRVDKLEAFLAQRPKMMYLTPNFQNPQGTTLSLGRRKTLIELARKHGVPVVEDNPYGELRYTGKPLPHLLELDAATPGSIGEEETLERSLVIYAGTFSKVLMPGLRVGWVIAARDVIDKLVQAKQGVDLHTSTFTQHVALELVTQGFLQEFVPLLVRTYGERRERMLAALEKYFPENITWTQPEGGMFLLVTLPKHVNSTELLPKALAQNVAFVPGAEFHLGGKGQNTLRLNFSNASLEKIETGIRRLGEVLRMECELENPRSNVKA
jgi:2-aminoadipate transaminase